jgi:peptidoglycan/xylan/chitin deacetylase (PgdA/CDA1 family)
MKKLQPVFIFIMLCLLSNASFAQRKIILKLDDFVVKNNTCSGSATLDYIVQKKIKATIGAVALKFDGSALGFLAPYLNAKNDINQKLFEVWHHGLDHINPEFSGTGYAYQKWHFDSANQLIQNYLRLQMHSFGTPFNHNDTVTNRVISENSNYKVCMFNDPAPASSILNLTNRVNMENGTGNPEYSYFLSNYNTYKTTYTDYMVLQGHPNVWGVNQITQFSQIIDFLVSEGCVFVQPYEYYLSLNPAIPLPVQSQTITFPALTSKVVGDTDFNANANATSGLDVLYNSSNSNVATIVNGNIHIIGSGTTIITASQQGDAIYKPADYVSQTLVVNAIDYRSAVSSGTWGSAASWEVRDANGNWSTATTIPATTNNVYIQSGHTIAVNVANAYCNDLHLNTSGILAISGNDTLNASGKIRAFTGAAVTGASASDGTFYSGQANTTTLVAAMLTTSANAVLKFVGRSRIITNTGEWAGSGTTNFALFALDADAIGTLGTAIKFRTITIASGTISIGNFTIAVGSSTGNGNLTIKNGAKLISGRAWTGVAGSQAITYNSLTKMGILQIDNGGMLELTAAASAIDCTNFINNGTVIYSGAAQTLVTTSAATNTGIGSAVPAVYNNLTIEGSGMKTLSVATTINGLLSVNAGTIATGANNLTLSGSAVLAPGTILSINGGVTDFTDKSILLQSSVSESGEPIAASIGAITGTLNNATNVTVQQYIPGGFRKYRFLSHPFTTAQPLSQLTDNIDITGAGGSVNGFTTTATNSPSAYYFTTANANGNANDGGWTAFADATSSSWAKGQGIRILVRGTKNQTNSLTGGVYTPSEVTLDMTGTINTGDVSIALSASGSGSSQGFNLVGNPYPSPVDIGTVLNAATNISGNTLYIRNPQIGSYTTVNPIPSSYVLPANSTFFVKAVAATNLNFSEANKNICSSCATVFRSNLKTFLQIKAFKNGIEYDNFYLTLDDAYKSSYETKYDAVKFNNDELSLYTISSDNQKLAADYRNLTAIDNVHVGIMLPTAYGIQHYILKVSDYNMLLGVKLYLHDKLKNSYTLIEKDATYILDIDPLNKLNIGDDRLEIVVDKSIITANIDNDNSKFDVNISTTESGFIVSYLGTREAMTNINLYNSNGQLIQTKYCGKQRAGQELLLFSKLPKGIYLVEVKMDNDRVTKKASKL